MQLISQRSFLHTVQGNFFFFFNLQRLGFNFENFVKKHMNENFSKIQNLDNEDVKIVFC